MKVLIVCNYNKGFISPFILDQVKAIKKFNVEFDFFLIKGHGVIGYLKNYIRYIKKIKEFNPDIIHAHYGLSGLFANLQRKLPIITTFHGSDINDRKERYFSFVANLLSKKSIFVSEGLIKKFCKTFLNKNKHLILPCGVDFNLFQENRKEYARRTMRLPLEKKLMLFSSRFDNKVKNYLLLEKSLTILSDNNIEVIELMNFSRKEVALLINAVDICVLTSITEGSPQFIKEAMACNCPIVSTDVGDVKEVIGKTEGCFISTFEPTDVAEKIKQALAFAKRTTGRKDIKHLEASIIAKRIIDVYQEVIKNN